MQAPAVLHWPQDMARVQDALQRSQTVVLCIAQPPGTTRPTARASVRLALQAALGAWLNCHATAVVLHSSPGTPLRLHHPAHHASLSISHEDGLSLAAIAPGCAVGVDLLATTTLPDSAECLQLAQDYLGPSTAQTLTALPAAEVPTAFALAWTMWEARLKCAGLGLVEWRPGPEEALHMQVVQALPLPAPYCGAVAWRQPFTP
jgi:4'-phosphopantetheinyl transferase